MRLPGYCIATLLTQAALAVTAQAAPPQYRVEAFAGPPGALRFSVTEINNAGSVSGTLVNPVTGREEAFLYHRGRYETPGSLGGFASAGIDVNRRGQLLVNTHDAFLHPLQAFVVSRGRASAIPLPTGATGPVVAVDINNAGHVLGITAGGGSALPFIYDGQVSRFIELPSVERLNLVGFNDRDEIVGDISFPDRSDIQPFTFSNGRLTVLPLPPDEPPVFRDFTRVFSTRINNAGQILANVSGTVDGHVEDEDFPVIHGAGGYTQIGPTNTSFFTDLNEKGWAVGGHVIDFGDPPTLRAAIYRDGQFFDLDRLLRPADAAVWTLSSSHALNDRGQVIGFGNLGAFIATPVPEPGALALMVAGLLGVGAGVRRRTG
jgi:PEP-CTERM putative exosortase interaction domain